MPTSLPTGTVSQTSAGTRTFPPDPVSDEERERVSAASTPHRRPSQTPQPPAPHGPRGPPAPVVPRREHDVAIAREHDRAAHLARENEALREYIREQATDKQAVIERYEHLLQQRDSLDASKPVTAPTQSRSPSSAERSSTTSVGLVETVRTTLATVRSRTARWLGLD